LPLTFAVPGTGFVALVFTATDLSNQTAAQSASFTFSNACGSLTVPNVAGLTQTAAASAIAGGGLIPGAVTFASSNSVPAGSVIAQNPAAGTAISSGSSLVVSLVISTGGAAVNPCAIQNGVSVSVSDVQAILNQALGAAPARNDLNLDGLVTVVDTQTVIGAALQSVCTAK
jgi:hypothetical protein